MTTTVQQLIEKLQSFPENSVITITNDVDDQEFAIVDFESENSTVNIVIGETGDAQAEE